MRLGVGKKKKPCPDMLLRATDSIRVKVKVLLPLAPKFGRDNKTKRFILRLLFHPTILRVFFFLI
jgi:hypothetical protein